MPPELIVFVGLQGAGKTTYYHANLAATHVHVSKDLMKNTVTGPPDRIGRSSRH
jgi:signal recognition particle GTPase